MKQIAAEMETAPIYVGGASPQVAEDNSECTVANCVLGGHKMCHRRQWRRYFLGHLFRHSAHLWAFGMARVPYASQKQRRDLARSKHIDCPPNMNLNPQAMKK